MSGFALEPADNIPLSDGCHHYKSKSEVPWDLQKYWSQRYSLFSIYDDGVHLTDDAWFGVTPEPVASQIAYEMTGAAPEKTLIIDLFAGAGGNTVAFALSEHWLKIIAVERDRDTLACAQNNATLYGVDDRITWVHADSFDFLRRFLSEQDTLHPSLRGQLDATVLFASPPWGGPGYRTDEIFDLHGMEPYNIQQLHDAYKSLDHALYLPRTSDLRQLGKLVPEGQKMEVVQYCMEGASKALVAYIPAEKSTSSTSIIGNSLL